MDGESIESDPFFADAPAPASVPAGGPRPAALVVRPRKRRRPPLLYALPSTGPVRSVPPPTLNPLARVPVPLGSPRPARPPARPATAVVREGYGQL